MAKCAYCKEEKIILDRFDKDEDMVEICDECWKRYVMDDRDDE